MHNFAHLQTEPIITPQLQFLNTPGLPPPPSCGIFVFFYRIKRPLWPAAAVVGSDSSASLFHNVAHSSLLINPQCGNRLLIISQFSFLSLG
ncbi:unnamed protein product [Protopolystoma xenopodis]|uniref:Uncharacterized protein n=1 Tax=Protopolystoma xenopodis TaxID=117903 RepID=A0A3S5ACU5_9PLAT|nr:unnamed protein product [Protopolystoma xenopodis]